MNEERYPCPCCGYRTYFLPAGGTMQVCPVCFWEDAPGEHPYNGSNGLDLHLAQINFLSFGVCEPRYADLVRAPLPEEARNPDWLSNEELRLKTIAMIEESFADVLLEGGVTLHQMDVLDDYGGEEAMRLAALKDPEKHWQDISFEKISHFTMSMCFLDAKGFRFHLPAFLRYALANYDPAQYLDADGAFFALSYGFTGHFGAEAAILNAEQRRAVAAFLVFAKRCCPFFRSNINKALKNGWDKWIPDFIGSTNH